MTFNDYFATHPVFTVREVRKAFADKLSPEATFKRLRYAAQTGRLTSVLRGVYAAVPPGSDASSFQPDVFLTMAALRQDAVFCGHSALELLGSAHSSWRSVTAYSKDRRMNLRVEGYQFRTFLPPELPDPELGLQRVDLAGVFLRVTGPERTLVEGFQHPCRVGDLEEFLNSADSFWSLDLDLLGRLLDQVRRRKMYAAVGWFLSRHPGRWHVEGAYLKHLEDSKPKSAQYLTRTMPDATLDKRWNLMVPRRLMTEGAGDAF